VATGYPSLRAAMPPRPLAETNLTKAQPSATLKTGSDGPYELLVSGGFKQAGASEAEAMYTIKAEGGGGSDEISGSLERSMVRLRTSRRGGTTASLQERLEHAHRLGHVHGGEVALAADSVDDQLESGLHVSLRSAGPNPTLFMVLGALALLGALAFDARLTDVKGKAKTYLAAALGVCFVFALDYQDEATPHSLVRPAVGSLVKALLIGGLGGWLLGAIGRGLFGPKLKKRRS
jgi:hypothetical protein